MTTAPNSAILDPVTNPVLTVAPQSKEDTTIGNALFFFAGGMMSLLRLPRGKLAFAQRSGAMKAPVGLLSDRTVLR